MFLSCCLYELPRVVRAALVGESTDNEPLSGSLPVSNAEQLWFVPAAVSDGFTVHYRSDQLVG